MKTGALKLLAVAVAILAAAPSFAQPGGMRRPLHVESLDLMVTSHSAVVTGMVTSFSNVGPSREVTVMIVENLKGRTISPVKVQVPQSPKEIQAWMDGSHLLLLGLPTGAGSITLIDLAAPDLAVLTADLKILHDPNDVVWAIRNQVKREGRTSTEGKIDHFSIPLAAKDYTSTPLTHQFARRSELLVDVPIDKRLETWGRSTIGSPDAHRRETAVDALGHFKSFDNMDILKPLLNDPSFDITGVPQFCNGFEPHHYPVRAKVYEILRHWGVDVDKPTIDDSVSKLSSTTALELDRTVDGHCDPDSKGPQEHQGLLRNGKDKAHRSPVGFAEPSRFHRVLRGSSGPESMTPA